MVYIGKLIFCLLIFVPVGHGITEDTFTGTYYEFGQHIGSTYSAALTNILDNSPFAALATSFSTDHSAILTAWIDLVTAEYPNIAQEIWGLAAGSGRTNDSIWLMNFEPDIVRHYDEGPPSLGFSTSMKTASGSIYIPDLWLTQQVDVDPVYAGQSILMTAQLFDDAGSLSEEFTSIMYPGQIAGRTFLKNRYDMFFTLNPTFIDYAAANSQYPIGALLRHVMTLRDAVAVRDHLESKVTGGFVLNMFQLGNYSYIEAYGADGSYMNFGSTTGSEVILYDYNQYLTLTTTETTLMMTPYASLARLGIISQRLGQPKITDLSVLLGILGNTEDMTYPIYRDKNSFDYGNSYTVVYDTCTGIMYLYDEENPSTGTAIQKSLVPRIISKK